MAYQLMGGGKLELAGDLLTCSKRDAKGKCLQYLPTCEWPGECLTESPGHPAIPGREKKKRKPAARRRTKAKRKAKPEPKPAKLRAFYFWIPKGARKPRRLKEMGQGLSTQGTLLPEVLQAAATGKGKVFVLEANSEPDALNRLEEGRRAEREDLRRHARPHETYEKGVFRISAYSATQASQFGPEPKLRLAANVTAAFDEEKARQMAKPRATDRSVIHDGLAAALQASGMSITAKELDDLLPTGSLWKRGDTIQKAGKITLANVIKRLEDTLKGDAYMAENNAHVTRIKGAIQGTHGIRDWVFKWEPEDWDARILRDKEMQVERELPDLTPGTRAFNEEARRRFEKDRPMEVRAWKNNRENALKYWLARKAEDFETSGRESRLRSDRLIQRAGLLEALRPGSKVAERCIQVAEKVATYSDLSAKGIKEEVKASRKMIADFKGLPGRTALGLAGLGGDLLTCRKWQVIGLPGAEIIRCAEYAQTCRPGDSDCQQAEAKKKTKPKKAKQKPKAPPKPKPEPPGPPEDVQLDPVEVRILRAVEYVFPGKIHIDEIQRRTGLSASKVSSGLVMLELKRMVQQSAGKMFAVKKAQTVKGRREREEAQKRRKS